MQLLVARAKLLLSLRSVVQAQRQEQVRWESPAGRAPHYLNMFGVCQVSHMWGCRPAEVTDEGGPCTVGCWRPCAEPCACRTRRSNAVSTQQVHRDHSVLLMWSQESAAKEDAPAGCSVPVSAEVAREQCGSADACSQRPSSQQTMDILHLLASLDFTQSSSGAGTHLLVSCQTISLMRHGQVSAPLHHDGALSQMILTLHQFHVSTRWSHSETLGCHVWVHLCVLPVSCCTSALMWATAGPLTAV
jgi:hypothetical protein